MPMQEWFQKLIGEDGYSNEGGKLLAGEINWKESPDNKEIREWIRALIRTPAEMKLPMIEGVITKKSFKGHLGRQKRIHHHLHQEWTTQYGSVLPKTMGWHQALQ